MSEQRTLSNGRRLWVKEEVHDLVYIHHEAEVKRPKAREDILYALRIEMKLDGLALDDYQCEVEAIVDAELDKRYGVVEETR